MTQPATHRLALIALVLGACTIGVGPILMRLTDTGPAAGGFWRMALALPLVAIPALRAPPVSARLRWIAILAGVLFGIDIALWHYGVALTSVANATTLSNTTPIVVTAAAWLLFREKPSRMFLAALALALGGAVLMAVARGSGGHGTNPPLGDALAAAAALFYGGYFVVARFARRNTDVATLMFWTSVGGAPVVLLVCLVLGEQIIPASLGGWAACAGLGVMHVVGQGLIAWALGRLPAALTSVVVLVQPVVAAGLGWLIFVEPIVPLQALGAAVLLSGVVLAQRSSIKSETA